MMDRTQESFDSLLREKLDELDADEALTEANRYDPVERLRLDARQAVLSTHDGPLPRGGHQGYVDPPAPPPPPPPGQRHLNILY